MPIVSVVVPCYREADNLANLHARSSTVMTSMGRSWELILVDDGSPDDTWDVAQRLAAADPHVRAVALSLNFGKESALLAGLRRSHGEAVVLMDADLQHPPELIPQMVELLGPGTDQVVARRDRRGDPWLRTMLSRGFYRLANRFLDVPLTDGVGDFRVLSRKATDAILALGEANRFSKGLFAWVGFGTRSIDYTNQGRAGGTSSWSLRRLVGYALDGAMAFTTKPLRAAIWLGSLAVLGALGYLVWLVWNVAVHGVEAPGYVTLVALLTGLSGVQLLCLGVLGEYVGRVFMEVKGRPHYLVRGDTRVEESSPDRQQPA